ncbi:hypothetical protein NliqN6_1392 [Naganishia liquefaciens]|uniref:5-demethoxyubiquinone hydroxylase, mitochondrial n=1 Tax=Naganishia liquefaciens TaxID=104408 RepID=A0A8H3TQY7_9TREE|nr:hypothetical protein NliqN6_1392 [Naganishia liquefaciens]
MSGLAFNRSIVRQRSRHAASIASPAQPSQSIRAVLNVRPYSAKYAPSQREPTAFASEAYHEREISGKPFRVDRYLRDPSPATTETPVDLTPEQRKIIERTLRVDLVGEGGANWIYQATKFVADLKGDKETSKKVEEMWSTERHHLRTLSTLQKQHRVRPTLLYPLWKAASLTVGAATAMMGSRAIMACTEAVETVIGEHYDDQIKALAAVFPLEDPNHLSSISEVKKDSSTPVEFNPDHSSSGMPSTISTASDPTPKAHLDNPAIHPSVPLMHKILQEFRDDELEHLDTAVDNGAQLTPGHALLSTVIETGCRGAIWVAARV